MPVLIKKTSSSRTFHFTNNHKPSPEPNMDNIIEALKGLTFKFDVKITDIFHDKSSTTPVAASPVSPVLSAPLESAQTVPKTIQLAPVPAAPKPHQVRVASPIPEPTHVVEAPASTIFKQTQLAPAPIAPKLTQLASASPVPRPTQPAPVPTVPKPTVVAPVVTSVPSLTSVTTVSHVQNSTPVAPGSPMQSPTVTVLKIGSTIDTYCLSLDEKEKVPVCYIIYSSDKAFELSNALSAVTNEIEALTEPRNLSVGNIVLAKSTEDDNWYRSTIESVDSDTVNVFFIDWGLREQLSKSRIKELSIPEISIKKYPAIVVRTRIVDTPTSLINDFFLGESSFRLEIIEYDAFADVYDAKIIKKVDQ